MNVSISEELEVGQPHPAEWAVVYGDDLWLPTLGPHHERQHILASAWPAKDVATQSVKKSGAWATVAVIPGSCVDGLSSWLPSH